MKKKLKLLFVTTFSLIFIISCKKEKVEVISQAKNIQDVYSESGILYFRNDSVFNQILLATLKKSDDDLDLWENTFTSFQSYRKLYLNVKKQIEESSTLEQYNNVIRSNTNLILFKDNQVQPNYFSGLFSKFYNKDGFFVIGNKLISYTENSFFISKPLSKDSLKLLVSKKINLNSSNLIEKEVSMESKKGELIVKNNSTVTYPYIAYGTIYSQLIVNGKRRLFIEVFNDPIPNTNKYVIYLKLKQQAKKLFGNWADGPTEYTVNDYTWNSVYVPFAPLSFASYSGSSGYYTSGEQYEYYEYFIPQYLLINSFNLDGQFDSRGVPNTERTQVYMNQF